MTDQRPRRRAEIVGDHEDQGPRRRAEVCNAQIKMETRREKLKQLACTLKKGFKIIP